jgi:hypothetical protein
MSSLFDNFFDSGGDITAVEIDKENINMQESIKNCLFLFDEIIKMCRCYS